MPCWLLACGAQSGLLPSSLLQPEYLFVTRLMLLAELEVESMQAHGHYHCCKC